MLTPKTCWTWRLHKGLRYAGFNSARVACSRLFAHHPAYDGRSDSSVELKLFEDLQQQLQSVQHDPHPGPALLQQLAGVEVAALALQLPAAYVLEHPWPPQQQAAAARQLAATQTLLGQQLLGCAPLLAALVACVEALLLRQANPLQQPPQAPQPPGSHDSSSRTSSNSSRRDIAVGCGHAEQQVALLQALAADVHHALLQFSPQQGEGKWEGTKGLQQQQQQQHSAMYSQAVAGGCVAQWPLQQQLLLAAALLRRYQQPGARAAARAGPAAAGVDPAPMRGGMWGTPEQHGTPSGGSIPATSPPTITTSSSSSSSSWRTGAPAIGQAGSTHHPPTHPGALLAALSSCSSTCATAANSAAAAPRVLLTQRQVGALLPLLRDAGLDLRQLCWGPGEDPLVSLGQQAVTATRWGPGEDNAAGDRPGDVLHTHSRLQLWPGPDGVLPLPDHWSITPAAVEVLTVAGGQQHAQGLHLAVPAGEEPAAPVCYTVASPTALPLPLLAAAGLVVLALPASAQAALAVHGDPAVRRLVYCAGSQPLYLMLTRVYCTTAQLRGQVAALCGSSSWAQQVLVGSALGGPTAAATFLHQLLHLLRPGAEEDLRQLQQLAARRAALAGVQLNDPGADADQSSSNGGGLHPADWGWALGQVQQVVQGEFSWPRDGAPYFTLPTLLPRLADLLAHTLGLALVPPGCGAGDAGDLPWPLTGDSMAPGWHRVGEQLVARVPLQLWDLEPLPAGSTGPPSSSTTSSSHDGGGACKPVLLGTVVVEVACGGAGGNPAASVLRPPGLRTKAAAVGDAHMGACITSSSSSSELEYQQGVVVLHLPFTEVPLGAADAMAPCDPPPATPPPSAAAQHADTAGGIAPGASSWGHPAAAAALRPLRDLLLPSPLALRMLLHEVGHALAALCPGWHLAAAAAEGGVTEPPTAAAAGSGAAAAGDAAWAAVSHGGSDVLPPSTSSAAPAGGPSPPPPRPAAAAAAAALGLLYCGRPGLDLAELPSHTLEHVATSPAALVALSCHARLGSRLGPAAASCLATLVAGGGGCGALAVHEAAVAALADLMVAGAQEEGVEGVGHGSRQQRQQQQAGQLTLQEQQQQQQHEDQHQQQHCAAEVARLQQLYRGVVAQHSLGPAAVTTSSAGLGVGQELAAGSVVGGRLAGYTSAKLLAAWAWSSSGVQGAVEGWGHQQGEDNRQPQQQQQQPACQEPAGREGCGLAGGGNVFKAGVLRVGSSQVAAVTLARGALGDPGGLQPVAGGGGGGGGVVGWVVDWDAAPAADLELLV